MKLSRFVGKKAINGKLKFEREIFSNFLNFLNGNFTHKISQFDTKKCLQKTGISPYELTRCSHFVIAHSSPRFVSFKRNAFVVEHESSIN
jgi:hypothetical protein